MKRAREWLLTFTQLLCARAQVEWNMSLMSERQVQALSRRNEDSNGGCGHVSASDAGADGKMASLGPISRVESGNTRRIRREFAARTKEDMKNLESELLGKWWSETQYGKIVKIHTNFTQLLCSVRRRNGESAGA